MPGFSQTMQAAILNEVFRQTEWPSPSSVHLALFTDDPTDENDISKELTDSGYVRQEVTTVFDAPDMDGGFIVNNAAITFPAIVDATVTITHVGFYDSATAGNLLASQALVAPKTLSVNDVLSFGIGKLKITCF